MIEAHRKKSSFCEIACAGVAKEKGFDAEERSWRAIVSGIADNIRRAVAEMRSAIFIPFTFFLPFAGDFKWAETRFA